VRKNCLEEPCICRRKDICRDVRSIARIIDGNVGRIVTGVRFPTSRIDPNDHTYGFVIKRLLKQGFAPASIFGIQSFDHPEGENLQKRFPSGLWYHVVVYYPKENSGGGLLRSQPNRRQVTPLVTVHCHATNPTGLAHIADRLFGNST